MRKLLFVFIVLIGSILTLAAIAYWDGYHRPYVPEPDWNTEVLFCASHGDGYVELGIRSIEYPTHRVPLIRIKSENYQGICDAWLKIDEENAK